MILQPAILLIPKAMFAANPKIAGTTHNVFGIQTGVAIMFLAKKEKQEGKCKIEYVALDDDWRKEIKLEWLRNNRFEKISFEKISPDKNNNWINLADTDFDSLLPLADKKSKQTIFEFSSLGVSTNRDEWVYDFDKKNLNDKIRFFIEKYNDFISNNDSSWSEVIKWSRDLKKKFEQKKKIYYDKKLLIQANYRPFIKQFWYAEKVINDILTQNHYDIFGSELEENIYLAQIGDVSQKPFTVLIGKYIPSLNYLSPASGCRLLPLYRYDKSGNRNDNITDWGLEQFHNHYKDKKIQKEDIFHYTYAVLHNPAYRQKYELNLKREFPRIPFYENFLKWANGKSIDGFAHQL